MKAESIVFAVAGMCFGVILGWVIGTQQAGPPAAAVATEAAAPPPQQAGQQAAPALDEARVQSLLTIIQNDPQNAGAHVQLGNVYFDAERYDDAIKYYEQALQLDPKDVNASTDLGVSYYYTNRPDEALEQFDRSLALDPQHTKTLLNQGIVRAFGKNDLAGAAASWRRVVEIAPQSQEGQAAQRGLDGIAASRGQGAPAAPAGS
ncbi:MAG: tetratricopeptide repeat protein [Vicinamibacterales bacterium]